MNRTLRTIAYLAAGTGLVDSIYLSWLKLANQECGVGDCDIVNSSQYAEINGVPIALLGAGTYVVILLVLYMQDQDNFIGNNYRMILFALTLVGVLYSAYLTYIEVAVIFAICPFCVVSAITMLVLFVITLIDMFSMGKEDPITQE
ncbi:MAG: hypothetical protein DWQ07_02045 [Chloroflexi bacterium]|nr:MAG: hypothetical protein DWQ07_02045 [Chloroflexota bacterium]MBL1193720.1 vitamin K epoxide reductase family protein [Chloroflexota bacterium]NOH11013.1 vitamin K epoxide reductase family protein [Chloroflexota bacterium]